MDISGNYTSPLERLSLMHVIEALIHLRGNSYVVKYSLNARAGKVEKDSFLRQFKKQKKSYVVYTVGSSQTQG